VIGPTFAQTLATAQAGDHDAIETIYRDVAPLVIGYLRSIGAIDPEDVASDVFVSMLRGLSSFSGDEQHFRSWLLTIAHRRLTDALRRSGRRPEDPAELDVVAGHVGSSQDVESEALDRLRIHGVLDALDRLTPDQRAALMLRVLADQSLSEISAILGKPQTAVKALLRRGTAALDRQLAEPEVVSPEPPGPIA
jgi:RNA polymerase sigma factor (sigma-70 family)